MQSTRYSSRPSRPPDRFGYTRLTFEGHGEWRTPRSYTTVPAGTQITIWTGMGTAIDDDIGVLIATGRPLPSTIPDNGYDSGGDIDTTLTGQQQGLSGHRRTFRQGERVPDLTLLPPDGLVVQPGSITVSVDTQLSELLSTYRGRDCHWAACAVLR